MAPHLNFLARAMVNSTKKLPEALAAASERCCDGKVTPGDTDYRECAIDGGQGLVVFIQRRVSDINHVAGLHAELLCDKNRHRLEQVQPENAAASRRIGL